MSPFLSASINLDTKTLTIASNRNFESYLSILCLVFLCLWQLCSLLCRPPQRSTERSKKKKRCLKSGAHYLCIGNGFLLQCVTFSGKSWSIIFDAGRSRCLVGLGRNNLLAWRESFANVYELKSHIWFEEEYNHFERIYRVYRSVWFSSNFTKTFQE